MPTSLRQQFKARLQQPDIIMMPGVFCGITAKMASKLGFEALYISGAGLHNIVGYTDTGLLSLEEFVLSLRYIVNSSTVPLLSDADTGFGDIQKCVEQFEEIGLCGLHLEDQVFPKRCGHLDGKTIVSIEEMQDRIRQAVAAKKDPDFMIMARVDARNTEGIHSAIDRAKAYIDAGANAIFAEALQSEEEYAAFSTQVKSHNNCNAPLLANMTEFGKTPYLTAKQFEALGYDMVIYPMTAFRIGMKAMQDALVELQELDTQEGFLDKMQTRQELYHLLDYTP